MKYTFAPLLQFPRLDRKSATFLLTSLLCLTSCVTEEGEEPYPPPGHHQHNVFASSDSWYINEWWSANAVHDEGPEIAQHSTAVWMEQLRDIEEIAPGEIDADHPANWGVGPDEGFGLREHLMAAQQQNNALIQLVLSNLPGRNCAAAISYGELPASEMGMRLYQTHYIDRIVKVLSDFPDVPVAAIIEPKSLLQLATTHKHGGCLEVSNRYSHGYVNGVRYAINQLSTLENVHIYVDAGSSNQFGWDDDLAIATQFMHGVMVGFEEVQSELTRRVGKITGTDPDSVTTALWFMEPPVTPAGGTHPPGYERIDGFITNVAEYVPLEEPYLGHPRNGLNDMPLMSAEFYDWNPRFDEWTYSADWLEAMRELGVRTDGLGMLIDTSRNGWGQATRSDTPPTQDPSLVDQRRLDRRIHRNNWCNQPAGIGRRPQAGPDNKNWIDAYVWIKPPGESDGPAEDKAGGNEANYQHNPMCVPEQLVLYPSVTSDELIEVGTGALPGGPYISRWHKIGFKTLIDHAWPPLCEGVNDDC